MLTKGPQTRQAGDQDQILEPTIPDDGGAANRKPQVEWPRASKSDVPQWISSSAFRILGFYLASDDTGQPPQDFNTYSGRVGASRLLLDGMGISSGVEFDGCREDKA